MSLEIKEHNGICYPKDNNCPVINAMLKDRTWEQKITNIFEDYVKPDWVCLDIGTFIGMHTMTLAKKCKFVIGFEAQPLIYSCLKRTIKSKDLNNVILHNVALSSSKGTTKIHTNNDGNASLQGIRDHKFKWSYHIKKNTLDSYDIPRVDLMKIDIEGSEWSAIEGGLNLIEKHRPSIIIETFRGKKNKEKLESFCKRFNYFHQYISADNYLLRQIVPLNIEKIE